MTSLHPQTTLETHLRVCPHDQLTEFIYHQHRNRKTERWTPEHAGNRRGVKDFLKPRSIQIDNGDQSCTNHPNGHDQVPSWSPERIRLQKRHSPVADSEKVAVLYEHHGHIAIPNQQSSRREEEDHLLDTLPGVHEACEFFDWLALPAILPLVVDQDDIVEVEAILIHVYEPHSHTARPSHEPEELVDRKPMLSETNAMTNQVNLEEQPPVCKTIPSGIPRPPQHEVRLRFLVHQRDGHDDIVCNREANLQVGTQGNLHSQHDIGEHCHEFGVGTDLGVITKFSHLRPGFDSDIPA